MVSLSPAVVAVLEMAFQLAALSEAPSSSCPPFTGFHLLPMMFVADCTCILAALFGKRGYDLLCRWSHSSPTLEEDEKEFYFCLIYFTYCSDSLNGILVWSAGVLPPQ